MKIKQAFVTRENLASIFSIIEAVLSTIPDTQVFVDDIIYFELRRNRSDYNVDFHNMENRDYFEGGELYFDEVIARASFISYCTGYMQLVEFHSSKVNYTHYLKGFKQLLLIRFKPEE